METTNQKTASGQPLKNKQITEDSLKQLLAKMLPETVLFERVVLYWKHGDAISTIALNHRVLDTELLHLASLVEAGLTVEADYDYLDALARIVDPKFGYRGELTLGIITATWQQRTRALAAVKGVTL